MDDHANETKALVKLLREYHEIRAENMALTAALNGYMAIGSIDSSDLKERLSAIRGSEKYMELKETDADSLRHLEESAENLDILKLWQQLSRTHRPS